ncbi:hypothetical protein HYU11_02385 [Candidatus Woesearchaeota archaeon]|nr:hypothetical protein [Candidatus Woesearchaeota archaeon]
MLTKEDITRTFKSIPKRKLTDVEKEVIYILVEKSKLEINNSVQILNKGFLMFVGVFIVAMLMKLYDVVPPIMINMLYLVGILVLVVIIYLYNREIENEKRTLDNLLDNFLR